MKRMMRENRRAHSREAGIPRRMDKTRAHFEREHTIIVYVDHVVCKKESSEKKLRMRAKRTVSVSQETLMVALNSNPGLIEDEATALVTQKGHKEIKRTENRVMSMLQGLVNKLVDEKVNSVRLESRILRKIGKVAPLPRDVTNMTATILDNQDSIASVAKITNEEAEKALNDDWKKRDRRRKLVEAAYSSGGRSILSSNRPSLTFLTNRRARRRTLRWQKNRHPDSRPEMKCSLVTS